MAAYSTFVCRFPEPNECQNIDTKFFIKIPGTAVRYQNVNNNNNNTYL